MQYVNAFTERQTVVFQVNMGRSQHFNVVLTLLLVDTASRRGTTSNQRWNDVVYFHDGIYNVEQRRINVVYFSFDMNNARQRRNNAVIFNVEFHNVGKRWHNIVKMTISKKNKNKNISNRIHEIQSFNYCFKSSSLYPHVKTNMS